MPIPPGIQALHVVAAAADLDSGIQHEFGEPTGYEVKVGAQWYAPKAVIGLAAGHAFGSPLGPHAFSGGEAPGHANPFLRSLGFEIRRISRFGETWSEASIREAIYAYFGLVHDHAAQRPVRDREVEASLLDAVGRTDGAKFVFLNISAALRDRDLPFLPEFHPRDRPGQKHVIALVGKHLDRFPDDADALQALLTTEPASPPSAARIPAGALTPGQLYTRPHLRELFGLPGKGGEFDTGYTAIGGEYVIFSTLGRAQTGHKYGNAWQSDAQFLWVGKPNSKLGQPRITAMLAPAARVHVFTRAHGRAPFTYHGLAAPLRAIDEMPVRVIWTVQPAPASPGDDEEIAGTLVTEGGRKDVTVRVYERDRTARGRCLRRWGTTCVCCKVPMSSSYGAAAADIVHAHHIRPVASIGQAYQLNPEIDMRPVCPNCHAVIHSRRPPFSVEEVAAMIDASR